MLDLGLAAALPATGSIPWLTRIRSFFSSDRGFLRRAFTWTEFAWKPVIHDAVKFFFRAYIGHMSAKLASSVESCRVAAGEFSHEDGAFLLAESLSIKRPKSQPTISKQESPAIIFVSFTNDRHRNPISEPLTNILRPSTNVCNRTANPIK